LSSTTVGFELTGERTPLRELLRDLWRSRPLVRMLGRQEFFVRYRRASFGLLWAVLIPLFQAIVLAAVLSQFVEFRVGVSYPVFVYSGLLMWTFFSTGLAAGSTAVVDGVGLSTKIYFPRAVLPLARIAANIYGLVLSAGVLLILALAVGEGIGFRVLFAIPALALVIAIAAGFALTLSAMHVYFRDVRYFVQAALIPWFYLSPVFYSLGRVGRLRPVIEANPVTGPILLLRAGIVDGGADLLVPLAWSTGWAAVLVGVGLVLHARYNRVFADLH
jgi:lipopolysaccharide transport system permease protein